MKQILTTINPSNEEILAKYKIVGKQKTAETVRKSRIAFREWKGSENIHRRSEFLHDFAAELRKNKPALARTVTTEMGKPIKESLSEVEKCA